MMQSDDAATSEASNVFPAVARMLGSGLYVLGCAALTCLGAIRWNGRPAPYAFTNCPTSFFIANLILIATGAALGMSNIADRARQRRIRFWLVRTGGGIVLGLQSYGLWLIWPLRLTSVGAGCRVSIILTAIDMLCLFSVLMLISFVAARVNPHIEAGGLGATDRLLLKVAVFYWYLLSLGWTLLLCGFAILL